jgi:hypothetical protein
MSCELLLSLANDTLESFVPQRVLHAPLCQHPGPSAEYADYAEQAEPAELTEQAVQTVEAVEGEHGCPVSGEFVPIGEVTKPTNTGRRLRTSHRFA